MPWPFPLPQGRDSLPAADTRTRTWFLHPCRASSAPLPPSFGLIHPLIPSGPRHSCLKASGRTTPALHAWVLQHPVQMLVSPPASRSPPPPPSSKPRLARLQTTLTTPVVLPVIVILMPTKIPQELACSKHSSVSLF